MPDEIKPQSLSSLQAELDCAVLDDALSLIQRAGALLNSVHVEDDPAKPADPAPQGFVGGRDKGDNGKAKSNLSRSLSSVN